MPCAPPTGALPAIAEISEIARKLLDISGNIAGKIAGKVAENFWQLRKRCPLTPDWFLLGVIFNTATAERVAKGNRVDGRGRIIGDALKILPTTFFGT